MGTCALLIYVGHRHGIDPIDFGALVLPEPHLSGVGSVSPRGSADSDFLWPHTPIVPRRQVTVALGFPVIFQFLPLAHSE